MWLQAVSRELISGCQKNFQGYRVSQASMSSQGVSKRFRVFQTVYDKLLEEIHSCSCELKMSAKGISNGVQGV